MTVRAFVLVLVLSSTADAQTAPELYGRIVDRAGAAIAGALVRIDELDARTVTDAAGHYRIRAARPCDCPVTVTRPGYAARNIVVTLRSGHTLRVDIELIEVAVPLSPIHVDATSSDARRLDRDAVVRTGAATAGDVLATLPSIVIAQSTPAGPQRISIRGGAPGQVLVLVDGVSINDPITGSADLSRIRAEDIESIVVLPGARSAQYGARAMAGVVTIETRGSKRPRELSADAGSLRSYGGGLVWSDDAGPVSWATGARLHRSHGAFDFTLHDVGGGISGTRQNADAETFDAHAAIATRLAGGTISLRPTIRHEERGLPGKAYAPTRKARERARTTQVSGTWRGDVGMLAGLVTMSYARQRVLLSDPQPAFGLPYDDTIALAELRADIRVTRQLRNVEVSGGAAVHTLRTATTTLTDASRRMHHLAVSGSAQWRRAQSPWFVNADLRADFDARRNVVYASHATTIGRGGPVRAQLSHRTGYAPPSLADQFFRESVGIAANPDLRAERVPDELEVDLGWRVGARPAELTLGLAAYAANTRDLIVWEPDYRFVWSPRNTDVRRRGIEATADATLHSLSLHGWFTHNRTTYNHSGGTVQLAYRPRNTAGLALSLTRPRWHARIDAHYLGDRNTAPTDLNRLRGFWTFSFAGSRTITGFGNDVVISMRGDRLLNEHDSLIFGFPEPRRLVVLEVRVTRKDPSTRKAADDTTDGHCAPTAGCRL
jgi:vitamin B12 transporter